MTDKDESIATGTERPDNPTDALRRRLLKASTAAPLIATLTPNSALALSSAAQCAGGDFSNKKFAKNGNSLNGDKAVRQAVDYWQKSGANGHDGLPNKIYLIDGKLYDQAGNSYPQSEATMARLNSDAYEHDTAYVLALYDVSEGEMSFAGLWPKVQVQDIHATPMTGSCWTSIAAGATGQLGS